MSILRKVRELLKDPRLKNIDYNSDELLKIHRQILSEKKSMRNVFVRFYSECIRLDIKYFSGNGLRVEIGAGASFFKQLYPEIVETDIKQGENLDMVLDALNMNLESNTVRGIYGINCFHHFRYPELFFKELSRVLIKRGGCILIEPYFGLVSSLFYKRMFDTEIFDKMQKSWDNSENNIMNGANQALSFIVFKRDRNKFKVLFPELEIVYENRLNNYLQYFLSGGLNFRSLVPFWLKPLVVFFEFTLIPINRIFALHHVIVIQKK